MTEPIEQGQLLPEDEYQSYVEKYPFAAEPTYFTRPNRYYGPASTWRSYTENERGVSDSLAAIESSDLSIHLYNTFALKQKGGATRHSWSTSRGRSKHVFEGNTPDQLQKPFVPPEIWTAWPLPLDQLPQLEHRDHESASEALQASLLATTLAIAKDQWNSREAETPQEGDAHEDSSKKRSPQLSASTNSVRETPSPGDTDEVAANALPEGVQTFSSQAFIEQDETDEETNSVPDQSDDEQPVFLADDEVALDLLNPSLRHIMSKVDDLLVGLHTARAAYANNDREARSRSRSLLSTGTDGDDRFIRAGSKGAVVKEMRKKRKRASEAEESQSTSRGRSSSRTSRKRKLGLRDWSDVIGMAALKGFKPEVITRASERCARLFGEDMMFRTFTEADRSQNFATTYVEEYALGEAESEVQDEEGSQAVALPGPEPVDDQHSSRNRAGSDNSTRHEQDVLTRSDFAYDFDADDLSCPVAACPRHTYQYGRPARLYDHIRREHTELDLETFQAKRADAIVIKHVNFSPQDSPTKRIKLDLQNSPRRGKTQHDTVHLETRRNSSSRSDS